MRHLVALLPLALVVACGPGSQQPDRRAAAPVPGEQIEDTRTDHSAPNDTARSSTGTAASIPIDRRVTRAVAISNRLN